MEEANIIRSMLRLNATRMTWKKHPLAPRLKNMLILTTYLSPLYEVDVSKESWEETIAKMIEDMAKTGFPSEPEIVQKQKCMKCGLEGESVRRCSRCKKISYCSPECQRADWKQHKKNCVA